MFVQWKFWPFFVLWAIVNVTCTDQNYTLNGLFLTSFSAMQLNVKMQAFLCWPRPLYRLFYSQYQQFNIKSNIQQWMHQYDDLNHQQLNIVDINCDKAQELLSLAANFNWFRAPNKWLIFDGLSPTNSFNLSYLPLLVDSNVIWVSKSETNEFHLTQPYKLKNHSIIHEPYGVWSLQFGYKDLRINPVISYRRKDLQGGLIKASTVVSHPETMKHLTDFKYPYFDAISKHAHMCNVMLIDYVNMNYSVRPVSEWGRPINTHNYTGMVGRLIRHEDDVGGSSLLMLSERLPIVKYVRANSPTRLVFVYRKPSLSYVRDIFSLSFPISVWTAIGLIMALIFLCILLAISWEIQATKTNIGDEFRLRNVLSDLFLFTLGGVCQQGCEMEPKRISSRIIMLFMLMSCMFLYVSYSANIVVLLQSSAPRLKNLKDLLDSPMKIGAMDIVYNRVWFSNANETIQKAIYNRMGPTGFYPIEVGVEMIRKGLFALHIEAGPCYHYVAMTFQEHEKCDLEEVGGFVQSVQSYLVLPHRSPYLEIFKVGWTRLDEHGLQQRSFLRLYKTKPICSGQNANFVSVGLVETYPIFLIWTYGLLLATLICTCEYGHHKFSRIHRISDMIFGAIKKKF